jgi:hypothetical protein
MIVYHGSYTAIDRIDLEQCEVGRDFGRGFYVTNIRSQAEYWAKRKGRRKHTGGIITEFDFDERICRIMKMNVLRFEGYNDNWLDFVVLNRINKDENQAHDYDIVEGPVADDDIAARIYDYVAKKVSREQFLRELTYKPFSHQICFCTVQSLQSLELHKEKIDVETIHIDNDIVKAMMTDFGLSELEATNMYYKSKIYSRLADETTLFYLKPWQEIYQKLREELKI